mmetsp:Transcript_36114/g.82940  ORF Transcript_36114/g.82940 Transcript_36114/m.82940 type:complete len:493 (+) Transcript_36114:38-1516(+)
MAKLHCDTSCVSRQFSAHGFIFFAVCLLQQRHAFAAVVQGSVDLHDIGQVFITKFCFDFKEGAKDEKAPPVGHVEISTSCPNCPKVQDQSLWLMVFDDEVPDPSKDFYGSWPRIKHDFTELSCKDLKQMSPKGPLKYSLLLDTTSSNMYIKPFDISETIRARFWYFTLVNCNTNDDTANTVGLAPKGVNMEYTVHVTNTLYGWQKEFSFDRVGVIYMYAFFAVLFGIPSVLLAQDYLRSLYDVRHRAVQDNPYLRPMLLAFLASEASCCAFFTFYCWFAWTGKDFRPFYVLATFWAVCANGMIYVMVSLASVGYGMNSSNQMSGFRVFAMIILVVGLLSTYLELSTFWVQDPSAYLYAYMSTSGVLAMLLKVVMCVLFGCKLVESYKTELNSRLKHFYWLLGCCFGAWFMNVPVMVCLAYALAHEWRFFVVTLVEICMRFVGQMMFAVFFCGPLSPFYALGVVLSVPTNIASTVMQDIPIQIGVSLKEEDVY